MDGVVSRLSGHDVQTIGRQKREDIARTYVPPAPKTAAKESARPTAPSPKKTQTAAPTEAPTAARSTKRRSRRNRKPRVKAAPIQKPTKAPTPPPPTEPDLGSMAALPATYAQDRLVMVAQDPSCAFAYWDLNPAHFAGGDRTRLTMVAEGSHDPIFSVPVHEAYGRHYFALPAADQRYVAMLSVDGHEQLRSTSVMAPPMLPRAVRAPRFVDVSSAKAVLDKREVTKTPPRLVNLAARRVAAASLPASSAGRAFIEWMRVEPEAARAEIGRAERKSKHPDRHDDRHDDRNEYGGSSDWSDTQ